VSEAYPHLIFDRFSSKLGTRVAAILKHLFPPPKHDTKRVITFANQVRRCVRQRAHLLCSSATGRTHWDEWGWSSKASGSLVNNRPYPPTKASGRAGVSSVLSPWLWQAYRVSPSSCTLVLLSFSSFQFQSDYISFRHHTYEMPKGVKSVTLKECGPRFELKLYQVGGRLLLLVLLVSLCTSISPIFHHQLLTPSLLPCSLPLALRLADQAGHSGPSPRRE
jgi:hypothetical protein